MELICNILFVLILVFITALSAHLVDKIRHKNTMQVSFKESLDLCELPVITFTVNDKKINLLLDSGSSVSIINSNELGNYSHTKLNYVGINYGVEGDKQATDYVKLDMEYKGIKFEEEFQSFDMSTAFNNIKSESGVTIHGILGSNFFTRYKYILDFENLVAVMKK